MSVQLRFITSESIVSKLIRWVTWSDYSHVDMVVPDGYLGAQVDGVKIRSFGYCKPTRYALAVVECDDEVTRKVLMFARSQIKKPYDLSALFGNLLHRDWDNPKAWFCSELVAAAFNYADYPLVDNRINRVTPRDIVESTRVKVIITYPPTKEVIA